MPGSRANCSTSFSKDQLSVIGEILKNGLNVRQTETYVEHYLEENQHAGRLKKTKRLMIIQDVRIYLNSIKQIAKSMEGSGIPVKVEQVLKGDDLIVTLHIKNSKKNK